MKAEGVVEVHGIAVRGEWSLVKKYSKK